MQDSNSKKISFKDACLFFVDGLKIALSKDCRAYLVVPIIINLLLLSIGGFAIVYFIRNYLLDYFGSDSTMFVALIYIFTFILGLLVSFVGCYIFSTIATIIASPFYGLLADKVEMKLNNTHGDDMNAFDLVKDVPRILCREVKKQIFFVILLFVCFCITLMPFINALSPLCFFALTCLMSCLQYSDYAYDNHKISFPNMMIDLKRNFVPTFTLGAIIAICLCIPFLNLLVPPAAVCAGTKYYLELQKQKSLIELKDK